MGSSINETQLVQSVARQLKHYLDLKRREDGFDLTGPNNPRLDHPPVKPRPLYTYAGLHDRSVKHYFAGLDGRVAVTNLDTKSKSKSQPEPPSEEIRGALSNQMSRTNFTDALLPNEFYEKTPNGGRRIRDRAPTGNILRPLNLPRPRPISGGEFPQLRSLPSPVMTRGEVVRLVNSAARLLANVKAAHLKLKHRSALEEEQQKTEQPQSDRTRKKRRERAASEHELEREQQEDETLETAVSKHGRESTKEKKLLSKRDKKEPTHLAKAPHERRRSSSAASSRRSSSPHEERVKRKHRASTARSRSPSPKSPARSRSHSPTPSRSPSPSHRSRSNKSSRAASPPQQPASLAKADADAEERRSPVAANAKASEEPSLATDEFALVKGGAPVAYAVRLEFSSREPAQRALNGFRATLVLFGPEGRSQPLALSAFKPAEQANRFYLEADKELTASPSVGQLMKITLTCQVSSGEHFLKGLSIADPQARFEYEFQCNHWFNEDDTQPLTLKWARLNPMPAATPPPPTPPPRLAPAGGQFSPHPPAGPPPAQTVAPRGESMAPPRGMYGEEEETSVSESLASTRRAEKPKSPAHALVSVPPPKEGRTSPAPPAPAKPEPSIAAVAVVGHGGSHSPTLTPSVSASLPPLPSSTASDVSDLEDEAEPSSAKKAASTPHSPTPKKPASPREARHESMAPLGHAEDEEESSSHSSRMSVRERALEAAAVLATAEPAARPEGMVPKRHVEEEDASTQRSNSSARSSSRLSPKPSTRERVQGAAEPPAKVAADEPAPRLEALEPKGKVEEVDDSSRSLSRQSPAPPPPPRPVPVPVPVPVPGPAHVPAAESHTSSATPTASSRSRASPHAAPPSKPEPVAAAVAGARPPAADAPKAREPESARSATSLSSRSSRSTGPSQTDASRSQGPLVDYSSLATTEQVGIT